MVDNVIHFIKNLAGFPAVKNIVKIG